MKPLTIKEAQKVIEEKNISEKILCEIWTAMNRWEWDERFSPKPEGFDDLKMYTNHFYERLMKRKTKEDYITAPMTAIELMVPYKNLLKCSRLSTGKCTDEEFERWWRVNGVAEEVSHIQLTKFKVGEEWRKMCRRWPWR